MVIQNGCQLKVALIRTKTRGWGIRTLEDLKRGTFVGVYSGELISANSSYKRRDDTYLFNLANTHVYQKKEQEQDPGSNEGHISEPEKESELEGCTIDENQVQTVDSNIINDEQYENIVAQMIETDDVETASEANEKQQQVEQQVAASDELAQVETNQLTADKADDSNRAAEGDEQFVCDAKFYGNFTRFINHSCQPNVIGIRTFTVHQDHKFPYISFFTNKDISANSELTLNYGDNYWLVKCKRDKVYCLCKRPCCRFSKRTFPRTFFKPGNLK